MSRGAHARPRPWWQLPVTALVGVGLLVALSLTSSSIRNQIHLSFTQVPVAYTELYFQSDPRVEEDPASGQSLHATFAVANHAEQSVEYSFRVSVMVDGRAAAIGEGVVMAPPTGTAVPVPITMAVSPEMLDGGRLRVDLLDRSQYIQYRLHPSS